MTRTALLFGLLLSACATAPAGGSAAEGRATSEQAPKGGALAALYRGACLGRCPEYQVEVYPDGEVIFRGKRNVATVGEARGRLSEEQLAQLARLFELANFGAFEGRYENLDTSDLPLVIVAYRGRLVRHAHGDSGAPVELTRLEDALDELLGTSRWVRAPEQ
jgi:hypothetical protein